MTNNIRAAARRYLPTPVRRPLGNLAGRFDQYFIRPLQGLLFDLSGGRFRADGCTFAIPKHLTTRAYRSCFFNNEYEAEERELVRAFVRPSDRVLELGACLGVVSCVTNKLLTDPAGHLVVEGNPLCIPVLEENRRLNQCRFIIEHCAVSTQPEVTFYLHPVYIVGGTTQRQSPNPVRLPGRSLAELDRRYGPFSALIMDIEGSEFDALESSRDVLQNYRLVIAELHEWAVGAEGVKRCREILTEAGLHFVRAAGITEAWERA